MKKRSLSFLTIRRRKKKYQKRSRVLTPGNKKHHKKKIVSEKEAFLKSKEDFGFHVKFSGGKRKRK